MCATQPVAEARPCLWYEMPGAELPQALRPAPPRLTLVPMLRSQHDGALLKQEFNCPQVHVEGVAPSQFLTSVSNKSNSRQIIHEIGIVTKVMSWSRSLAQAFA